MTRSYGGPDEAARLRRHHERTVFTPEQAAELFPCDYCDSGDTPFEGRHLVPDPEGIEGTWSVPCPRS